MDLEQFESGHLQQRDHYKSFEPTLINHEWTWQDASINAMLESATHALGQINAFSLIVPDIDCFISMHVVKEAQTSSKIEGTQTGIDEVLLEEKYVNPERRDDRREVLNYIEAINTAVTRLDTLPLSNRLLRETHRILLHGARGEHKQPGEFRTSQNWIGGSNLQNAAFIPPHPENVPELMGDLELFWHNDTIAVPHLIRKCGLYSSPSRECPRAHGRLGAVLAQRHHRGTSSHSYRLKPLSIRNHPSLSGR